MMKKYSINDWFFYLGDNEIAWQKDFNDETWQSVTVPHDWSITQDFTKEASSGTGYLPGGIGWYRAHVDAKELGELKDRILQLRFDGVYKNCQVWVNGYHMGSWASGYSSFQFDLTEILSYNTNDEIVVAVRVDHTDIADSRWYNGTGISRPVAIVSSNPVMVDRYGVTFETTSLNDTIASVKTKTAVTNLSGVKNTATVKQTLTDATGNTVTIGESQITLEDNEIYEVQFEAAVKEAKLWRPQTPNLYTLATTIISDGKENSYEEKVGIRTFEFTADNGFILNNKDNVKLKGVCLHEDAGCFGTAVPKAVWLRRLLKLKEAGCNAIRMAHNPHSQILYDLCDELGFFVFDEAFDEWENPKNKWWQGHNVYPPKYEGYAKDFPVWHKKDLVNMVLRNKNHPSIIAWSVGNEIDYPNDPYANDLFNEMEGNNDANKPAEERIYNPNRPDTRRLTTIAKQLSEIVHKEDATRPTTLAAAFPELSYQTGLVDSVDVIGYNYKEHLYEEHHRLFPNKPFIGSENRHSYQNWLAVKDNDYIAGQFLWTGIDYLGESRGVWPKHGTYRGLLDMCGYETMMFYKRKSWWSEELTARLFTRPAKEKSEDPWEAVYRKWNYSEGEQVEIRLYTNADSFELKVNEERIALTFDEVEGYYSTIVPFVAGPLILTAQKDGEVITDTLKAVGQGQRLTANVWQVPMAFKMLLPQDEVIQQIELSIVDKEENLTDANQVIHFEGENCEFLGFENGDMDDITNYGEKYRRARNGRAICYVKTKVAMEAKAMFSVAGFHDLIITL
ncbi:glycoside hydrolase family 2 TIM barrel-domain containing protein [Enterococcus montenegrensis]|uniref:glycoside hydrolase family 2 TIM barrel-domain containing protein n=1 Tax=Enterococcus montenegrensis TaxID=3031993 RepID=UPI00249F923F|nr:glycoside hydrolase family 2 TIM barrel-domain containing protein [Enterococcus montenegrensis]WHA09867.1 glycoside hydrolase family 2 TIM barrel-domain containing protein [Enterococcus montenegrensis]